jgi:acyl-CoA reductase-like NAD-dependent aldehyde dehydrogenase
MDKPVITLLKSQAYIDGAWVGTPSMAVTNKATGDIIGRVPDMGATETRQAIEAADRAFKTWSKLLAKERSKILRTWFDLIIAETDQLALLMSYEKPRAKSPMARRSLSSSPKKPSASMARPSRRTKATPALSASSSQLASLVRLHRGTSRLR